MRRQQQAEKEEQQRIKNLVLNLELRDEGDAVEGDNPLSYVLQPNPNIKPNMRNSRAPFKRRPMTPNFPKDSENNYAHSKVSDQGALDKHPQNPYVQPRLDKAGKGRSTQRARQLQVSDLDWYSNPHGSTTEAAIQRRRGHPHKPAAVGPGGRV
jgi:regulator of nonsense transcripts 2